MSNGKTMRHFVLTLMNFGTVDLPKRRNQQCPARHWYCTTCYTTTYMPSRPTRS